MSKPTTNPPPPPTSSSFSYRDTSYNTEQRKAVQSYPTTSYTAPTTSTYTPKDTYASALGQTYSKPEFLGSSSYLDKTDYDPVYQPPSYGSKADLNLHGSPMADSPSRPQQAPTYEDRINTVLRKYPKYSSGPDHNNGSGHAVQKSASYSNFDSLKRTDFSNLNNLGQVGPGAACTLHHNIPTIMPRLTRTSWAFHCRWQIRGCLCSGQSSRE